jgi:hypothetical protein
MNEEAGLIIATWPHGERPGYAFWYCDEVWCGIEYQVASHLIYEGFVEQGLAIVKGVRDRHTGERRNPWDEFECGHHYARSMASYALLLALSGFSYSAPERRIGFAPRVNQNNFRVFFSVGSGWGWYGQKLSPNEAQVTMKIEHGRLELSKLIGQFGRRKRVEASVSGRQVAASLRTDCQGFCISFPDPITINEGEQLNVLLR